MADLVKLGATFLSATAVEAMSEALALISEAGIDRRAYMELLTATVFNATSYTTYSPPAAFAAPLA